MKKYIIRGVGTEVMSGIEEDLKKLGAEIQGRSPRQFQILFAGDILVLKKIPGVKFAEAVIQHFLLSE